ncbi:hypothetical protein ACVR1N_03405 [Streptococcus constellatus subsp. pharyngis]|uniref:Uncharacterized protein n=1 Tax=Streptococcus constellatus subsp. pharyngis SK1060 = CCUG 46377 TaxID=1035184 RepID=F9P8T5_STRCV|nr:hypothetical protein [Streptococcus constellatus]QBX13729.1 hypothetical protein Javan101_0038 [Streptococcus phage Javan101]QBX13833.1 hypothetical protein Javan107_0038 [Streptococcus phage Javan107]QBX13927.1 hypothetical protein Javan113_0039 [Streptococcus phage Javan113]QBX22947.1 hypothetical protein Javan104_0038 [Streptococcus phage Javan104]AGU72936.1 hypothetical protein SCRE_1103 [Streptococcus constellatus subsp. pharyngis C232]
MDIYTILLCTILGIYVFLGLYLNYMTIRDDIRREKERKAEKKRPDNNTTPLHRSR